MTSLQRPPPLLLLMVMLFLVALPTSHHPAPATEPPHRSSAPANDAHKSFVPASHTAEGALTTVPLRQPASPPELPASAIPGLPSQGDPALQQTTAPAAVTKHVTTTPRAETLTTATIVPQESTTTTDKSRFPTSCICCNIMIGNLSIIVSGMTMTVIGSAATLDLDWITTMCPEATSLTVRVNAETVTIGSAEKLRLRELDLADNRLDDVPDAVLKMEGLRRLSLADNQISKLPQEQLETMFLRLESVDLTGNPLQCSPDLVWLDAMPSVQHWGTLTCVTAWRNRFEQSRPKLLHRVVAEIRRVWASCAVCRCRLESIQPTQVTMDCSGAGLVRLPDSLPEGVITLNVSGNQLTIAPLCQLLSVNNRNLSALDLSHNQLTSITPADLRCSGRLGRLDLRHNQLARLDWKELEGALRNETGFVFLSRNRWDCRYEEETMQFWRFIVGHHSAVLDFRDVLCDENGAPHAGKPIASLLAEGNCWRRPFPLNPLDLVIAVELLLIAILACKFARDAHRYRRAGQLPWPAPRRARTDLHVRMVIQPAAVRRQK